VIRVLFVCFGNICRSPMAEAVFRHMRDQAGLSDQIEVASAGTMELNEGKPAHRGTQAELLRHGIVYEGRARRVRPADLYEADYVVAMDAENVRDLRSMVPRDMLNGKLRLLLDFSPPGYPSMVPDPIYDGKFDLVYDLVEAGCRGLLDFIRQEHGL
jgi:protein-tyrosine phosphatase